MPLDFASMLLQPTKTSAWDLSPGPASGAREQLRLAREKFEWEKKHADEQARLERQRQAAEMAKARLNAEAEKAAKLQEDRLKVYGEFTKANGEGNFEAARAMAPMMNALGMGVELEGEVDGMPRYRVDMDAAAAQAEEAKRAAQTSPYGEGETAEQSLSRLGAMGLGGEMGSLQPPLGIRSSDEVDPVTGASVADRVSATYGMPGEKEPTAAPDEEDYTGGVPKNVIDTGASAAATLARLDPSLKGMVAAFPDEETRRGAEAVRMGLRDSGLPFEKQAGLFDKAVGQAATQRNAQINAQAQADRFRETRDDLTEKDRAKMRETGRKGADELAQRNDIPGGVKALRTADEIDDLLEDTGPGAKENDTMIAGALMSIQDVKGIPSDRDLAMAFGMDKASTITQVLDYIGTKVQGGFQPEQRAAIKSFIERVRQSQKEKLTAYLDSTDTIPDYNEHEAEGYRGRAKRAVPGYIYNEWLDTKKARDEGRAGDKGTKSAQLSAPGKQFDPNPVSGDFEIELESLAMENDLDPEKIAPLVKHESGGDPKAVSSAGASGVLQIMPTHLRKMGIEPEEFRKLSATEQLPYAMRFFKDNGITSDSSADDYALAVGASDPKWRGMPDSTVIYPKGSKEWKANKPWRPADDGDITKESMLRFYGLRGKEGGKAKASELPEPKTAAEKRYLELLKKRGG